MYLFYNFLNLENGDDQGDFDLKAREQEFWPSEDIHAKKNMKEELMNDRKDVVDVIINIL